MYGYGTFEINIRADSSPSECFKTFDTNIKELNLKEKR